MMTADSITITIEGTFDIARGRNELRKLVNEQGWSLPFGTRASAILTAMGELVLQCQPHSDHARIILNVVRQGAVPHLEMVCRCRLTGQPSGAFDQARERLQSSAPEVKIDHSETALHLRLLLKAV
ncbi:MAG: hypothetical protein MUE40_14300 [Anaerolineae bacterium]|nr:hypothetical protein [Anaerolineae bacterium]